MWVQGYRNSTVHALEIVLGFRKHPVFKVISYMEISTYFPVPYIYSQNYLLIRTPHNPTLKNSNNTFSFSNVQLFAMVVYMDKPNTTNIPIQS